MPRKNNVRRLTIYHNAMYISSVSGQVAPGTFIVASLEMLATLDPAGFLQAVGTVKMVAGENGNLDKGPRTTIEYGL